MSSTRIGRVTKGRVFVYLVCGLFVVALVACYKNASNLLEEAESAYDRCRQEQESISQQLHVVFDYKQRLEKTLQSEKTEQQNAKQEFTDKLNEEKLKCEKNANEAKLRFSTLQQHYNLLQTQHDDFKEECSKIQREQLDSINQLQAKLKEVQEEMKRTSTDKENSIHHVRAQKDALEAENAHLKEKIAHLLNNKPEPVRRTEYSSTQFNKIIPVGNTQYLVEKQEQNEHNENAAVLPPPAGSQPKAYTPKTSSARALNALNAAMPLNAPSPTPETSKSSTTKKALLLPIPYQNNVPDGVVRAPDLNIDDSKDKNADEKEAPLRKAADREGERGGKREEVFDNRYKNVGDKPEDKKDDLKDQFNIQADHEDFANEVFDNHPVIDAGKDAKEAKGKDRAGDDLNAEPNEVDYDAQNLGDEGEDGDDAADGAHPLVQDEVVRN